MLFIESVSNVGQSGGLSAQTVNASTITVQSAQPTSHLTHQRQIEAVERIWQVLKKLESEFSSIVFVDTILTPQELDALFRDRQHSQIAAYVGEYADETIALRKFENAGANLVASERPFVTHRLWSVFFILKAIYGRTALLLSNSFRERRFVNWREDSGCDELLRSILPAHAVENAKGQLCYGLRTAIDYLENQFIAEAGMNKPQI